MKTISTYLFLCMLLLTACKEGKAPPSASRQHAPTQAELIAANKLMIKKEKQDILDYIRRYGYDMQATGSGLYYHVYAEQPSQPALALGDAIQVHYTLSALNGDTIYGAADHKHYSLVLGKSDKESGLLEALSLMHYGEQARLIVPAHLAFGLLGDQEKVPAKTSLVYDIAIEQKK